ncbi:hypothetical protein M422DRAFT_264099 [Sphaerobolus stellatus SS14]|uniref:Uncharacterized protein n=1 Tax=Sphaerobolus stellatus (strain SS14) TaxID=990650 RepID=A0A0C9V911_SPHS4|nr:hypothetical protein M422DRAFT_264099 [Sphaerobolus stellatus SS14]
MKKTYSHTRKYGKCRWSARAYPRFMRASQHILLMIKQGLDLLDGFRIACKNLDASVGVNPTCRAVFRKPSTYPTAIIAPFRTIAYRVLTPSQIHECPAHLWIGVKRATVTLAVHRLECSMRIPILFASVSLQSEGI